MRYAQLSIQWYAHVYRSSRYQRATQIIGGEKTRRVSWIDAWQIHAQALQDDEGPSSVYSDSQDTDDPVDLSVGCPAKEEEPGRWESGG